MINQKTIDLITASLDKEEIKQLLINDIHGDYWYNINKSSNSKYTGFCYLVSELYYSLDGKSKKWWFKEINSPELLPYNGMHYYLENKETGEKLDITKSQFGSTKIPYYLAKNKGIRFVSKNCNKFRKLLEL